MQSTDSGKIEFYNDRLIGDPWSTLLKFKNNIPLVYFN
jgi:hypothetical protein